MRALISAKLPTLSQSTNNDVKYLFNGKNNRDWRIEVGDKEKVTKTKDNTQSYLFGWNKKIIIK